MEQTSLFNALLGSQHPLGVIDVQFSEKERRIDFEVAFEAGSKFTCTACGAETQPIHSTLQREWQYLNFFQFDAYIHARLPRVRCASKWNRSQIDQMHTLSKMRLKTTRVWRIKESLREIYYSNCNREEAERLLTQWYSWARGTGLIR